MSEKIILVWFRNDLRIHDNEILLEATRKADKVLPVYCFDPFYYSKNPSGNPKTGSLRARFLLESVTDLRNNLRQIGGDLIVRVGDPAEVLPELAQQYQVCEVYHHREVAHEETNISEQVEAALWKMKLNLKHFIGHTLYHKEDLPFPIKDIPDSFAVFKKKIERDTTVRPCIASPDHINTPHIIDPGELPTLQALGLDEPADDKRSAHFFIGGETAALNQLKHFFLHKRDLNKGNRAPAADNYSSKLSPWIALGCVSLRKVYWEVLQHENNTNTNQVHQVLLDLLWRDYFRFMFKKHGQKFIAHKQPENAAPTVDPSDGQAFENWKHGDTGVPLVDAMMRELNATGYINHYSRQIVAGFLVNDLNVSWVHGAAYFEEKLIDYSPASNWGNWAFVAGVNDARESKYQIPAKPAMELETKNDFIDTWLHPVGDAGCQAY